MASYATLQDAFGIDSFGAPVHDEMNGTEHFDGRPVITDARHRGAQAAARSPVQESVVQSAVHEDMHNVYSTREYMTQPAQGPHMEEMPPRSMVPYNPHTQRRRTTAKRHDVEPFVQTADLIAPLQALPPVQRDIVTAGIVGAVVYMLLSLLE